MNKKNLKKISKVSKWFAILRLAFNSYEINYQSM